MTLKEAAELDFQNLTEEDLENMSTMDFQNKLYDSFSIFRGLVRHFIFLHPCWKQDYGRWTNDDKRFAKEILKFSLSYSSLQDVKP